MAVQIINQDFSPVYDQLTEYMYSEIKNGNWQKGERLPTEPELAKLLNTSRYSLRKAIKNLIERGLIKQVKGQGTFVADSFSPATKKKRIGIISHAKAEMLMRNIYYSVIIVGIEAAFSDVFANNEIVLLQRSFEYDLLTQANYENLDGVINIACADKDYLSKQLNNFPHVLIDCNHEYAKKNNYVSVSIDYQKSFKEQLEYLIKLGHKNIASIVNLDRDADSLNKVFKKYNLTANQPSILPLAQLEKTSIKSVIDSVLEKKPSALLICSYLHAIAGYSYLKELGIKIPEELSFAGVGNYRKYFEQSDVDFATSEQPTQQMGEIAGKMLLTQLSGNSLAQRQKLLDCKPLFKPTVASFHQKSSTSKVFIEEQVV